MFSIINYNVYVKQGTEAVRLAIIFVITAERAFFNMRVFVFSQVS